MSPFWAISSQNYAWQAFVNNEVIEA